ncbi:peripheral plasma membrane protein CASK-like isoform X8, partial [Dinothrombium tinctorium]
GRFNAVYECIHRQSGIKYIVKIINCNKVREEKINLDNEETRIQTLKLLSMKHKYCCQLIETYSLSNGLLFTVNDYIYGRNIIQEIVERAKDGFIYSENVVSYYFRQILDALIYCQSLGIIHGNLSPSSIMVNTHLSSCPVKIVGFGYSIIGCIPDSRTNYYVAPESKSVLSKDCDVWSVGALLYTLLSGYWMSPIKNNDSYEKLKKDISFARNWCQISESAKDLVKSLLNISPNKRMELKEAREHMWIKERDSFVSKNHLSHTVASLRRCHRIRILLKKIEESFLTFDEENDTETDCPTINIMQTLINTCTANYGEDLISEETKMFLSLFAKYKDAKLVLVPELHSSALQSFNEIISSLPDGNILKQLLLSPHFINLFRIQNMVVNDIFTKKLETQEDENGVQEEELNIFNDAMPRVKLIQFEKNSNEAMGITLKLDENGRCIVSRIMIGGLIFRQATLNVGDEIIEINGRQVSGESIENLQRVLRDASGQVSFKIIPSKSRCNIKQCAIYIRAQFDFNPINDPLIPCPAQQLGLEFKVGDILKVINKDDYYWWQAIKENDKKIGLIPSPQLREWKISIENSEFDDEKAKKGCKNIKQKLLKGVQLKKKKVLTLYKLKTEIPCYEEVIKIPCYKRKTLVLIGAHGVGRRHIKNTLICNHPELYSYPIPHTTRLARKGEENGKHYFFVSEEQMLIDIMNNEYLEYGTHEGSFYGTKLQTIKDIILVEEKIAILDIEPQSLLLLRNGTFAPFVVFISAPNIISSIENDTSLCRLSRESDYIQNNFKHYFDLIVVNNDIEETAKKVEKAFAFFNSNSQWIPVSWIY